MVKRYLLAIKRVKRLKLNDSLTIAPVHPLLKDVRNCPMGTHLALPRSSCAGKRSGILSAMQLTRIVAGTEFDTGAVGGPTGLKECGVAVVVPTDLKICGVAVVVAANK